MACGRLEGRWGVTAEFGAEQLADWAGRGEVLLQAARHDIDALNIFPVPDGDTGTNLLLTWQAASLALADARSGDGSGARSGAGSGARSGDGERDWPPQRRHGHGERSWGLEVTPG